MQKNILKVMIDFLSFFYYSYIFRYLGNTLARKLVFLYPYLKEGGDMDLTKNTVLYADMLECKRKNQPVFYEDEHALCMQDIYNQMLYCASNNEESAKQMVQAMPNNFSMIVAHDKYTDQFIQERFHIPCTLECYHTMYTKKDKPEVILPKGYTIHLLDEHYLPEIMSLYSMEDCNDEDYLRPCIEDGMVGVFQGDILCGFMGVHEKSSMGILEVKPEYRHQGLAVALIHQVVGMQMDRGRIPYGEIVKDNIASIKLQEKAGLVVSKELTYWYFP